MVTSHLQLSLGVLLQIEAIQYLLQALLLLTAANSIGHNITPASRIRFGLVYPPFPCASVIWLGTGP